MKAQPFSSRFRSGFAAVALLSWMSNASAEPCCVAQTCADLTPAECATQAGILGYCRIGNPCGEATCAGPLIRPISDLQAVSNNTDLWLSWTADPNANVYFAHSVTDKRDVPTCETTGTPVPGSAPSTIAEAVHVGALLPSPDPLRYYCVEGGCPPSTGACCSLGLCEEGKIEEDCLGVYLGDGSTCPNPACQSVADVTPCLVGGNVLFLNGDPTEWVHPGIDTITSGIFSGVATDGDHVRINVVPTSPSQGLWWQVTFSSHNIPAPLVVGTYELAEQYPVEPPGRPGMNVVGDSRGCPTLHGRFQIHDISMMDTTLFRLTAAWEQTCDFRPGAVLRGCVHFEQ